MLFLTLLISTALGQECPEGCTYEDLCVEPPVDSCAWQAVPSDDQDAVEWLDHHGAWHGSGLWATSVAKSCPYRAGRQLGPSRNKSLRD